MFAAKAGAKKVIGIDCSNIIDRARQIVKQNDLDHIITLIKGKVEEVSLPDNIQKVRFYMYVRFLTLYRLILSYPNGWGTVCSTKQCCQQYCMPVTSGWQKVESSCPTRRPCILQLSVCPPCILSDGLYLPLEDRKYKNSKINWWDNVYGFDMSCMKKVAVSEPLVDCCENHQVCCRSQKFIEFDLYKVTPFSLKYSSSPMPVDKNIFR